jgi:hypothetical protein
VIRERAQPSLELLLWFGQIVQGEQVGQCRAGASGMRTAQRLQCRKRDLRVFELQPRHVLDKSGVKRAAGRP